MTQLGLALLISGLGLGACSGVEELALNPQQPATAGTNNQVSAGSGGKGGEAGSSSTPAENGGTTQAGSGPAGGQGGAFTLPCADNDDCQSDTTPYCRVDGICVACLKDDDCGDDRKCDEASSTCTGGTPEGSGGAETSGGDGP
jgi:hypothetical protein